MEENYINLIKNFKELNIEDKKEEIRKSIYDLIKLFYFENKKIDNFNVAIGILKDYYDDDEYFDLLFSYVMTLREEAAKMVEKINGQC